MNKNRIYNCLQALVSCLLLETTFSLKAQAIDYTISRSAEDLVLPDKELTLNDVAPLPDDNFFDRQKPTAITVQPTATQSAASSLDLDPKVMNNSPTLQRWIKEVPNVATDITNDPSFRTRIRVQYLIVRLSRHSRNFNVSIEDLRLGSTHATINADFQVTSNNHQTWGTDIQYYVYPLGSYVNLAPVIGYQNLKINAYSTSGVNLGFRLLLVLSRSGGTDISLTQTWVAPGSDEEAGLSTLSFGYAINRQVRLSTNLQHQNTKRGINNRVGIGVEWML